MTTEHHDLSNAPLRVQLEGLLDGHRVALRECLDGLTEAQVRRRLFPSRTTLLGLVKHATFVDKVWFDEAITHRHRAAMGIASTREESFVLAPHDTIPSVPAAHLQACAESRVASSLFSLDHILTGNRRGPLTLRWVYLHMIEELAQHCGHAEILREQVLDHLEQAG